MAFNFESTRIVTPSSGGEVNFNGDYMLTIVSTGLLTSLTVSLPDWVESGQSFFITFLGAVLALTWDIGEGKSKVGLPSAVVAGERLNVVYIDSTNTWYRVV